MICVAEYRSRLLPKRFQQQRITPYRYVSQKSLTVVQTTKQGIHCKGGIMDEETKRSTIVNCTPCCLCGNLQHW